MILHLHCCISLVLRCIEQSRFLLSQVRKTGRPSSWHSLRKRWKTASSGCLVALLGHSWIKAQTKYHIQTSLIRYAAPQRHINVQNLIGLCYDVSQCHLQNLFVMLYGRYTALLHLVLSICMQNPSSNRLCRVSGCHWLSRAFAAVLQGESLVAYVLHKQIKEYCGLTLERCPGIDPLLQGGLGTINPKHG